MDGMMFDHEDEDEQSLHVDTGSFTSTDAGDKDKGGKKGKQGGGIFSEGTTEREGVFFDETDGFDPTELQGLPYYDFISARRKGLPLRRRMTDQSDQYLRSFLDEADLREHVYEVEASEHHGHPTLLLDTGHLIQFQLYSNDLQRVRVSADIDPEIGVRIAMKAFLAAGKSINPKDVKFGSSEDFEKRMKPVWTRCYTDMQRGRTPHIDIGVSSKPSVPRASMRR
jgi:hypothetical protein